MKPIKLINPELQKPWLLIAVYDSLLETQISLMNKLEYHLSFGIHEYKKSIPEEKARRIRMLTDAIEQTKTSLREADRQIHNYIISHNKPNRYLKAS